MNRRQAIKAIPCTEEGGTGWPSGFRLYERHVMDRVCRKFWEIFEANPRLTIAQAWRFVFRIEVRREPT